MEIDTAKRAGALAEQIEDKAARIAELNEILGGEWQLSEFRLSSPSAKHNVLLGVDMATAKQAIGSALQNYQAQLDALNAELAEL